MKNVLILGAGMVSEPVIVYLLKKDIYNVTIATYNAEETQEKYKHRKKLHILKWEANDVGTLNTLVNSSDLVISLLPPTMHVKVAKLCITHKVNMVTPSYISPEMAKLNQKSKESGIIILNEIGEDPGLDLIISKKIIDQVKNEGGKVTSLISFGSGIPSFESNNNPFSYKFSWSPKGLISAANADAVYLKNGERVDVLAEELFRHFYIIDIENLGSFEAYPNRNSISYRERFELDEDVTLYRGLLRYVGYCNTMDKLRKMKLLENTKIRKFKDITYSDFIADLIGSENINIVSEIANYFNIGEKDDFINKIKWLGLLNDSIIQIENGTNSDVLVDLMVKKMSYKPGEMDMIIVHGQVEAKIKGKVEKRTGTLVVKGDPNGGLAMSKAVGLPVAIAANLILEGKIKQTGVLMPTLPQIYNPVMDELKFFGFDFKFNKTEI